MQFIPSYLRFIRHSYPAETNVNRVSSFLRRRFVIPRCVFLYFYHQKTKTRLQLDQDFPLSAGELDNKTGAGLEKNEKVEKVEKILKVGPSREILKILVGNWVAQWDQTYKAWFYYNINSGLSSVLVF